MDMLAVIKMKCDEEHKRIVKDATIHALNGTHDVHPWQTTAPLPGLLPGIYRQSISCSANLYRRWLLMYL